MAVVQILAFLLAVLGIAKKFQLKFVEAVPVGTSLLVMLLYGLSFFRALSLSDYLAAAFLLLTGNLPFSRRFWRLCRCFGENRHGIMKLL